MGNVTTTQKGEALELKHPTDHYFCDPQIFADGRRPSAENQQQFEIIIVG